MTPERFMYLVLIGTCGPEDFDRSCDELTEAWLKDHPADRTPNRRHNVRRSFKDAIEAARECLAEVET